MTITVYTQPDCRGCAATKRWLVKRGQPFVELSARLHIEWLRAHGYTSAPVVTVTDAQGKVVDSWAGYQPARLKQAVLAAC